LLIAHELCGARGVTQWAAVRPWCDRAILFRPMCRMAVEPASSQPEVPQGWRDDRPGALTDLRDPSAQRAMVTRIRSGDVTAFEVVFRAYRPALARLAERLLSSPEAAGDVVQEVFLKIWRTRDTWEPGTNLTAYLFAMTRNAALNVGRRRALESKWQDRLESDDESLMMTDPAAAPDAMMEARDRSEALAGAVARLPDRVRETFLLRWREQLTYAEVAATLGVPVKTVEKRLGRAFASLRRALGPWISGER
jgi:RNA polymerase sigma-70 factor (ECF subfamily)